MGILIVTKITKQKDFKAKAQKPAPKFKLDSRNGSLLCHNCGTVFPKGSILERDNYCPICKEHDAIGRMAYRKRKK